MNRKLRVLKALSDRTRLEIVEFLLGGEQCVCRIHPHVKRSQSTVSLQLGKLEGWGIVRQRREGKYAYYSVADGTVRKVLHALGANGGKEDGGEEKGCC